MPALVAQIAAATERASFLETPRRASAGSTCRRSSTCGTARTARLRRSSRRRGRGASVPVRKAALPASAGGDPPSTMIFTPDTEFGSRLLVEVVRGCANLCRFCWAGYNYLPVRAFPADRILEIARAARAARQPDRARVDRALRSSRDRAPAVGAARDGLFDQPGVAAPRRSDRARRAPAPRERRAVDHDRPRDRLRPPAPRDQQDDDERRDPRSRRSHLPDRHREPEALLHDRPADGNRRRSGGDPRPVDRDQGAHAGARPPARAARAHQRQREPARAEARHRLPVAADGGRRP